MAYQSLADMYDDELTLAVKEARGLRRKKKKAKKEKFKVPKAPKPSSRTKMVAIASSALSKYRAAKKRLDEDMARDLRE